MCFPQQCATALPKKEAQLDNSIAKPELLDKQHSCYHYTTNLASTQHGHAHLRYGH